MMKTRLRSNGNPIKFTPSVIDHAKSEPPTVGASILQEAERFHTVEQMQLLTADDLPNDVKVSAMPLRFPARAGGTELFMWMELADRQHVMQQLRRPIKIKSSVQNRVDLNNGIKTVIAR